MLRNKIFHSVFSLKWLFYVCFSPFCSSTFLILSLLVFFSVFHSSFMSISLYYLFLPLCFSPFCFILPLLLPYFLSYSLLLYYFSSLVSFPLSVFLSVYGLLTVQHLDVILGNDQLDALFSNVFISTPLHISSSKSSSSGGPTCINTPSGITHSFLPTGLPDSHPLECVIPDGILIQVGPPDDEHLLLETCRGVEINTLEKSASSWSLTRISVFIALYCSLFFPSIFLCFFRFSIYSTVYLLLLSFLLCWFILSPVPCFFYSQQIYQEKTVNS